MNDQQKSWEAWLASKTGKDSQQWPIADQNYLFNRLWHAFHDGYNAGYESSRFANREDSAKDASARRT